MVLRSSPHNTRKGGLSIKSVQLALFGVLGVLLVLAAISGIWLLHFNPHDNETHNGLLAIANKNNDISPQDVLRKHQVRKHQQDNQEQKIVEEPVSNDQSYAYWRGLAVRLGQSPPDEILLELETNDPFGVRRFEQALLQEESDTGHFVSSQKLKEIFPCPPIHQRITLPEARNMTRIDEFRHGQGFLFFQHLRKAGGTNFCTLAENNLPKQALPRYYCMPDWGWGEKGRKTGAGYLHHWSNADILRNMQAKGHRVAGNEWDMFDPTRHFDLPAVFATSFRRPVERAFSQFRFECLEDRGCKIKNVTQWWERRQDLRNIYTRTFADPPLYGLRKNMTETNQEAGIQRGKLVGHALDVVAQFHLVTVMEWLAYAAPLVTSVLGFQQLSSLTKRTRPHIRQAPRHDGPNSNQLGAKGVIENNLKSKEQMSDEQFRQMSQDLALDEILTDAARRMFLERLVCDAP